MSSQMTTLRQQGMQNTYDLANKKGLQLDQVITTILTNSDATLKNYIVSQGEVPVKDKVGRAVQAVFLRANQIATTAATLGVTDEAALETIEKADTDALNNGTADSNSLLDVPTQSAIACALEYISQQSGKSMAQVVRGVDNLAKNIISKANNDDGSGDVSSWFDWTDNSTSDPVADAAGSTDVSLSPVSIGSSLAAIPVDSTVSVAAGIPTIATAASSSALAGDSSNTAGGVLNSISGILSGITSVANSVTQAAHAVQGSTSAVNQVGGSIGASSIQQYVHNNRMLIAFVIIIFLLVIWFAIRGKQ